MANELSLYDELSNKRNEAFKKWDTAYNLVKTELESLISSFDDMKNIQNPQFQDLTLKFYCIHLCNYFYFHVRNLLVKKNKGSEILKLLQNGFSNVSNTPSITVMNDLLSYLISDDERKLRNLKDEYKKVNELRNKFAHGASNETNFSITFDEFNQIYEDIKNI